MHKVSFLTGLLFFGSLLAASPAMAQAPAGNQSSAVAPQLEIGVDRSNLSSQSAAVQEKTLHDIHALGAVWFRDGPSSGSTTGTANFVALVRRAKQQNLKVLVNILQMDTDYDGSLTTNRCGWKAKPLSRINLSKFTTRLRTLFGALKSAGLTIDAAEFGNEDDLDCYDADVPSGHAATPQELTTWLRGYGAFLQTGAEVLHDAQCFPQAKIITFGIAHGSDVWDHPPHHLSNPAHDVMLLSDVDGVDYLDNHAYHVDGYGTHVYASANDPATSAMGTLHEDAAALGHDKPLWITEWGFADLNAFPNARHQTVAQGMTQMLTAFDRARRSIPVGPAMFYRYDVWLTDPAGNLLPSATALSAYAQHRSR